MCGLCGILERGGRAADPVRLRRMNATLAHRGPDGEGFFIDGPLGLGHKRLAILDLAGGAQPLGNEDGSVQIAFNGEIWNHHALRAELAPRHTFRTKSDTEVLVHLYEERGPELTDALDGFFAFALWDARAQRLVLARDRLGKKPLFFARTAERLLFASEPRAILAGLEARPEPDAAALADVLALRHVRAGRSGYAGIEALLPGEVAVFDAAAGGALEPLRRRYWSLPPPAAEERGAAASEAPRPPSATALEEFRALFDAAVERRLEADVPLGLLLSGGIDSTAVLEAMARIARARGGQPLRTFTVAFSRAADSEAGAARALARHFGAHHHEFELSERELLDHVDDVLPHLDQPFGDPSFLPTTLVCGLARGAVTVALCGDGGDELFGGYERYARTLAHAAGGAASRSSLLARVRARGLTGSRSADPFARGWKLARDRERAMLSPERFYATELCALEPAVRAALAGPRLHALDADAHALGADAHTLESTLAAELAGSAPLAARMMAHDLASYLPGLILTKADRASMARSLELRAPFLDRALVEWAQRLAVGEKLAGAERKRLVRHALAERVPRALWDRPKKGFGTPLGRWFRGELRPYADGFLGSSRLAADGWLDQRGIDRVRDSHRRRRRNFGEALWTLLALEVWYRTHVLA